MRGIELFVSEKSFWSTEPLYIGEPLKKKLVRRRRILRRAAADWAGARRKVLGRSMRPGTFFEPQPTSKSFFTWAEVLRFCRLSFERFSKLGSKNAKGYGFGGLAETIPLHLEDGR